MVLGEVIKNCPLTEISDHKQFLFLEVMSYLWSKCNGMKDSKGVRGYSCCCTNCLGQEHFSKAHLLHGRTFDCALWNELKIDARSMLSRREWYQNAANLYRYNF